MPEVDLHQVISTLLMQGYIGRGILQSGLARESGRINTPITASVLSLIGPSGIGKSINLSNILNLSDRAM